MVSVICFIDSFFVISLHNFRSAANIPASVMYLHGEPPHTDSFHSNIHSKVKLKEIFNIRRAPQRPPLWASALPIVLLLTALISIIIVEGAHAINDYSQAVLLGASAVALVLAFFTGALSRRGLKVGFARSARQILPAVPMLVFIAMVATTWMMSGVVPTLIDYGLGLLDPTLFLVTTCAVCGLISVLTGSSWTTIATIGVAFMGIGSVMGYHPGWVAGAIISGAYFGDKVSPLSDTTVVASSTCGVDLFTHIRYLMFTAVPALVVALTVYLIVGLTTETAGAVESADLVGALEHSFSLSPLTLLIPLVTLTMIAMRIPTLVTLASAALMGFVGIFVFQPSLASLPDATAALWGGFSPGSDNAAFNDLVTTGGISGMISTITLVLSAMVFGCVMIGTGMLSVITDSFTRSLRRRGSIVSATVGSGLFANACTADQYLSLIITGNMYRTLYQRFRLEPRLLSRTIEDSVSVTSVLIPWNSCGITQSTVLGVSTLVYFPFCIFNLLSPCMSIIIAWTGYKIRTLSRKPVVSAA